MNNIVFKIQFKLFICSRSKKITLYIACDYTNFLLVHVFCSGNITRFFVSLFYCCRRAPFGKQEAEGLAQTVHGFAWRNQRPWQHIEEVARSGETAPRNPGCFLFRRSCWGGSLGGHVLQQQSLWDFLVQDGAAGPEPGIHEGGPADVEYQRRREAQVSGRGQSSAAANLGVSSF